MHRNRRRIRGRRGRRLMRRRGETTERSFALVYDTGGMRRTHLRGLEPGKTPVPILPGIYGLSFIKNARMSSVNR